MSEIQYPRTIPWEGTPQPLTNAQLPRKPRTPVYRTDITGQTFHWLKALHRTKNNFHGKPVEWACRCRCGKKHIVNQAALTGGFVKSCGCWARHVARGKHAAALERKMMFFLQVAKRNKMIGTQAQIAWNTILACRFLK